MSTSSSILPSTPRALVVELVVEEADIGARLDQLVARVLADDPRGSSRARVKALFAKGKVRLKNGALAKPAQRAGTGMGTSAPGTGTSTSASATLATVGDTLTISLDDSDLPEAAQPIRAQNLPLCVVYEDEDIIVVNKPAGMLSHPSAGEPDGSLCNALLAHCGPSFAHVGAPSRPGIAHRLDKDTTGLMVAAKTARAHTALAEMFRLRPPSLRRVYLAIVWGEPDTLDNQGLWNAPLARRPGERRFRVMPDTDRARDARTRWRVLRRWRWAQGKAAGSTFACLLQLRLETGRTHQARVHAAWAGTPILGDPLYAPRDHGRAFALPEPARGLALTLPRQALHASELSLEHPTQPGTTPHWRAPYPDDMAALVAEFDKIAIIDSP